MSFRAASLTTAVPPATSGDSADFHLIGPRHSLSLRGRRRALMPGGLDTLETRARGFFDAGHDGPALLAGAIPYDRQARDCLFQPQDTLPIADHAAAAMPPGPARLRPDPAPDLWRRSVAEAVARITRGDFSKIVLSRSLLLLAERPWDAAALLARMRLDPLVTAFSVPLPPGTTAAPRRLVGATPELLIARRGREVLSHPLAGSARRMADAALDQAAAQSLRASDKNLREHAMAAEMVLDTLAPWCDQLAAPEGVSLSATARMWHLGTRITGRLRDPDTGSATLLAALHPTPAVCGLPRAAAEAALPGLEGYDRGFYAGAVGWLEGSGDGAWYLALRCAEIEGTSARLYAGAGIVAGSDPQAEEDETQAKFLAMLAAFGQDEATAPAQV